MAADTESHTQYACKVVDLRRFKTRDSTSFGRWQKPAKAQDVSIDREIQKIRILTKRKRDENRLKSLRAQTQKEAEILKDLSHPNIIGFERMFVTDDTIYLIQELLTGGDLFSYLESQGGRVNEVDAVVMMYQIVTGLEHLHMNHVVHRDLKPENILLASKASGCRVVLTDFGCAMKMEHSTAKMATFVGTEEYAAPELLRVKDGSRTNEAYTSSIDLWSLGCITATLLIGASPFSDHGTHQFSQQVARQCDLTYLHASQFWQQLPTRTKDFVQKLLVLDSSARMTARQAHAHEWFTSTIYEAELKGQYERSVRHWRPRPQLCPVFETFNGGCLLEPTPLVEEEPPKKRRKFKSAIPVDPPYKPYARNMYRTLFPRRTTAGAMTPEVRQAIRLNWSVAEVKGNNLCQEVIEVRRSNSLSRRAFSPTAWGFSVSCEGDNIRSESFDTRSDPHLSKPGNLLSGTPESGQSRSGDASAKNERLTAHEENSQMEENNGCRVTGHVEVKARVTCPDPASARDPALQEISANTDGKIKSAAHVVKSIKLMAANPKRRRDSSLFDLE